MHGGKSTGPLDLAAHGSAMRGAWARKAGLDGALPAPLSMPQLATKLRAVLTLALTSLEHRCLDPDADVKAIEASLSTVTRTVERLAIITKQHPDAAAPADDANSSSDALRALLVARLKPFLPTTEPKP